MGKNTERFLDNAEVHLEDAVRWAEIALENAKNNLKEWRKDRMKTEHFDAELEKAGE